MPVLPAPLHNPYTGNVPPARTLVWAYGPAGVRNSGQYRANSHGGPLRILMKCAVTTAARTGETGGTP